MACLPFCMHGVIFAKRTSPSAKHVYPFLISPNLRSSGLETVPLTASTESIGTNEVDSSSARERSAGLLGLISHTSPSVTIRHPAGSGRSWSFSTIASNVVMQQTSLFWFHGVDLTVFRLLGARPIHLRP